MKKSVYILNLLQFIFFTLIMIINIGVYNSYEKNYKQIESLVNPEVVISLKYIFNGESFDNQNIEYKKIKPIIDELIEENKIKETIIPNEGQIDLKGRSENLYISFVDKTFLNRYNLKVIEGREFEDVELEGIKNAKEIPVIIGYGLKDKYKVGDILYQDIPIGFKVEGDYLIFENDKYYQKMYNTKLKVIGIAEKGSMIYLGNDLPYSIMQDDTIAYTVPYLVETIVYEDGVVISGNSDVSFSKDSKNLFQSQLLIEVLDKSEKVEILKILNDEIKKHSENLQFIDAKEESDINIAYRQMYYSTMVLSLILGVFSIIGVISTMIYSIEGLKKEYGILLSIGCKKTTLIMQNILLVVSIILISLGISFSISYLLRGVITDLAQEDLIGIENLFLIDSNLIISITKTLVVVLLLSIIPIIYKIKRYTILELLRGRN